MPRVAPTNALRVARGQTNAAAMVSIRGRVEALDPAKGRLRLRADGKALEVRLTEKTLIRGRGGVVRREDITIGDGVAGVAEKDAQGGLQVLTLRVGSLGQAPARPSEVERPLEKQAPPVE